jgi:hypothetical protein
MQAWAETRDGVREKALYVMNYCRPIRFPFRSKGERERERERELANDSCIGSR